MLPHWSPYTADERVDESEAEKIGILVGPSLVYLAIPIRSVTVLRSVRKTEKWKKIVLAVEFSSERLFKLKDIT